MKKNDIIIFASAVIVAVTLLSTNHVLAQTQLPPQTPSVAKQHAHAVLTPQEQQLSHCDASTINSVPPLVPGAFPVCPGSSLMPTTPSGPSAAEIQSHAPFEKLNAIQALIQQRHAAQPNASLDQILQQLTDQGLMNCPAVKNPGHACQLSSPVAPNGITPPIAP